METVFPLNKRIDIPISKVNEHVMLLYFSSVAFYFQATLLEILKEQEPERKLQIFYKDEEPAPDQTKKVELGWSVLRRKSPDIIKRCNEVAQKLAKSALCCPDVQTIFLSKWTMTYDENSDVVGIYVCFY
jgi:hypothetical protein